MKTFYLSVLSIFTTFSLLAQGSGHKLEFNGSSSYVSCGTVNMSGTGLTMMGWVNITQFNNTVGGAAANITSLWGSEVGGTSPTLMRLGDGAALDKEKVQFVINSNGSPSKLNGTASLTAGKWYHLAGVYDGVTMKIYINGELDASKSETGTLSSNVLFNLGQNYDPARTLNGQLDEVSVFRSALSQATIKEWMCQKIKPSHPNYSSLEAYWKMDNASGTTVSDLSGKGHHGSLTFGPLWKISEVPLGDTCVSDFTSPHKLVLSHPDGDSVVVDSITGATGAYLYRVDAKPNSQSFQGGKTIYDSTRYWGVYYLTSSTARGDFEYFFANNQHYKTYGGCLTNLFERNDNSGTSWTNSLGSLNAGAIKKRNQLAREYVIGYTGSSRIYSKDSARVCLGDSIMLRHTTSGYTYKWYRNNSLITSNSSNTLYAKDSGNYYLITQFGVCDDTSNTVKFRTNAKPTVSFSALTPVCASEAQYTLTGESPAGGRFISNYVVGNIFVAKTAGPGTYNIIYEYTDGIGCKDTASQNLTVLALPSTSMGTMGDVCVDSSDFTITGGTPTGGDYYVNGTKGSVFSPSTVGAGSHWIKYVYTDANLCSNQDSTKVTVNPLPTLQLILSKKVFCEYDALYLPIGESPRGGVYSGTGITGGKFDPASAGVGKHTLTYAFTDPLTGCKNSISDDVTVNAKPAKPVITTVGGELSTGAADTYQWHDKNGKILGETKQTFKPTLKGSYLVQVTVNGCVSDMSEPFTPGNVSVAENILDQRRIYPMPFSSELNIELVENEHVSFEIVSMEGKILLAGFLTDSQHSINTESLEKGTYILRFESEEYTSMRAVIKF
ncbi:MAG: T9SS type A sorting domain-containing protein [Flavobacteriales bacterium]|nr:T9SS type A sorting domain-containing protein [Flavobacteriales bacterium]